MYDTATPPIAAEQLFYSAVLKLSKYGSRPVLIIAGNHDSPEKLVAPSPIATELSIIILGTTGTILPSGNYPHVVKSCEGFVELIINGEKVCVTAVPYAGERRLNELLGDTSFFDDEAALQKTYSDKVAALFAASAEHVSEGAISIAVGHFYVVGGQVTDSERDISLGGTYAVYGDALPKNVQYVAMGHLHRPQKIKTHCQHAYYSGSPLQYSKSELGYKKCVYIADIKAGQEANVWQRELTIYKPIEVWRFDGIDEALKVCEEKKDVTAWVYIEILTDTPLTFEQIKAIKTFRPDAVQTAVVLKSDEQRQESVERTTERTILEEFTEFYRENRGCAPNAQLIKIFSELLNETDNT